MEKTATMNLRINPSVKQGAEEVLRELGIPMATAIDIYSRQIAMTKGLPGIVNISPVENSRIFIWQFGNLATLTHFPA